MYAYIRGKLVLANPSHVTIESNGLGFKVLIPASVFGKLPQIDHEVLLHTSFIIRENSQALYGFISIQERDLFDELLNVSGIGPKIALSLIGHLPLAELQRAIINHEIAAICKVPGVGKKTAERLIIEMRDKINAHLGHDPSEFSIKLPQGKGTIVRDAMSALINLGYNQNTAQKALKKTLSDLPEDVDLGTIITTALKHV